MFPLEVLIPKQAESTPDSKLTRTRPADRPDDAEGKERADDNKTPLAYRRPPRRGTDGRSSGKKRVPQLLRPLSPLFTIRGNPFTALRGAARLCWREVKFSSIAAVNSKGDLYSAPLPFFITV